MKYSTKQSYKSVELPRESAEDFKRYLKDNAIHYEASECYNLIHFEVLVDEYEEKECNQYLENPDGYWQTYDAWKAGWI